MTLRKTCVILSRKHVRLRFKGLVTIYLVFRHQTCEFRPIDSWLGHSSSSHPWFWLTTGHLSFFWSMAAVTARPLGGSIPHLILPFYQLNQALQVLVHSLTLSDTQAYARYMRDSRCTSKVRYKVSGRYTNGTGNAISSVKCRAAILETFIT